MLQKIRQFVWFTWKIVEFQEKILIVKVLIERKNLMVETVFDLHEK